MKINTSLLTILAVSFVLFQCKSAPEEPKKTELPENVKTSIYQRIAEDVFPSIAIALIDSSGISYFNTGKTSEAGLMVNKNSIYEIGSISKVFTATLLAQQVLDGDITLDDKINDLLPEEVKVPVMGDLEITIGNLSDHTSGLPRMPDNFTPANPNNPFADFTVEQMYECISNYQPLREVGEAYEYSNLAVGLLGHLLAENKNTTYEDLMIQTIAEPLEMTATKIILDENMTKKLALGHSAGEVVENWDIPTLAGAGAIRSSSADMAKFISAHLGYTESALKDAMELTHQVRHDKAGGLRVGLAWHIQEGEDGDVLWHNGGTGGYRTFAGFVKATGKGVVVLTNSSIGADDIGFHLLDPGTELTEVKSKNEAVELPEATLEQYVGVYEIQPEFKITVSREGSQLHAQATGQPQFDIYPKNDTLFYLTVVEAEISFSIVDGVVEKLTLFQGGQVIPGKKVD